MTKTLRKGLVITLLGISLVSFASNIVLFKYLEGISPKQPNTATGEIYQQNDHGSYFYIDRKQFVIKEALWYLFVVFAVGAALLEYRWRTINNPYDDLPKKDISGAG